MLFHVEPQFYSDELPIIPDITHVYGGDAERDFEDDHLVQRKMSMSTVD